jgi:hypothetical protein
VRAVQAASAGASDGGRVDGGARAAREAQQAPRLGRVSRGSALNPPQESSTHPEELNPDSRSRVVCGMPLVTCCMPPVGMPGELQESRGANPGSHGRFGASERLGRAGAPERAHRAPLRRMQNEGLGSGQAQHSSMEADMERSVGLGHTPSRTAHTYVRTQTRTHARTRTHAQIHTTHRQAREWIEAVLGKPLSSASLHEALKDGTA